ncbi:MAG TPA: hypothetical protein VGS19_23275 [Streptosporangiaceae bacterium]|nr:hypothetical protein [Streptosporangiaceae bacterium]
MELVPVGGQARRGDRRLNTRQTRVRLARVGTATASAAGLLLVTGCFSSSGNSANGGGATITVSAPAGVADAPLYIGMRDGLFRNAGIHLVVRSQPTVTGEVANLRKGKTDIAFGDYTDLFWASLRSPAKDGLTIVADGYDCAPNMLEVLTLPQYNISSAADLAHPPKGLLPKGVTKISIGVPSADEITGQGTANVPHSEEELAAWGVLSNNRVGSSKVNWVGVPPGLDLLNALLTGPQAPGGVEAIVASEPDIYTAEQQLGAVPVLDICGGSDANSGLPLDGYFTTHSFAASHATALTAFRSALEQAQADATSSAGSIDTVLSQTTAMDPMTAALVSLGTYPTNTSADNLQRVAEQMFILGVVPPGTNNPPNVSSMIFH